MKNGLANRLQAHVDHLAGEIGERNMHNLASLRRAEDYIRDALTGHGYEVVEQGFVARSVRCINIEATRKGTRNPERFLVVGAHYDSVDGSPGADDNASGIACMLELARGFARVQPAMSVRFLAFANEEPPFYMQGSRHYASAARKRGDDIRLMISLEMLGYFTDERNSQSYPPLFRYFFPDRGNFIGMVANLRSRRPLKRLAAAFESASDFPLQHVATLGIVPGVGWSDHQAFWLNRYPGAMVTDTAFYRNPHYHSENDTPETLDYARFASVTEGLFGALVALANDGL